MKKTMLVIILALVFALAACTAAEKEPEIFNYEWDEEISSSFEGMKFTLWQELFETDDTYVLGYRPDSPLADELKDRIASIEALHECSIEIINDVNYTGMLACGMTPADIVYRDLNDFRHYIHAGLVLPVDEYSDVIDVTDSFKWGFPNCLEMMMSGGKLYGVYPASWPENVGGYCFALICNTGLLYVNGYEHPQEYVENGKWSRELLLEMINTCGDNDAGIYGLETYPEWWARMCVYANGVKYLVKNNDGTYKNGFSTDAALDGLEWARTSMRDVKNVMRNSTDSTYFNNGQAAFTLDWGMLAMTKYPYNSALTDVSMPPFPMNPVYNDYGNWAGYLSVYTSCIFMPINTPNVPQAAIVIDELFAPVGGIENEEDLFDYYSKNIFTNENDYKCFRTAMQNSEFAYSTDGDCFTMVNRILNGNYGMSAIQAVQTYGSGSGWQDVLEYVVPNKEAYKTYFGIDYFETYYN